MREIEQIYYNDFGVAFHWKKNNVVLKNKVQIVFKETGFYFSLKEIKQFNHIIDNACRKLDCGTCSQREKCHKFLLKTPLSEIDLAVSEDELLHIKDLMEGTLFTLEMLDYINSIGRN